MRPLGQGCPRRLGATADGRGVNFAVFSAHAAAIEICLFSPDGQRETERITLPERTDQVWHGHIAGLAPGQLYGLRAHGPYAPEAGHRFNPHKLLVDPYARALAGRLRWHDALYGYRRGGPLDDLGFDRRDSAAYLPRSVVVEDRAERTAHARPRRSWSETVIYEAHVKGLTRLHPDIPELLRGTYEALGHPVVIAHLERLGVTAIELLPVHAIADERFLVERGLSNYWGYSTIGFFAPEPRYFGPDGPDGLRRAIRRLHEAGIEVILDVVYNHTAEGGEDGPTLSLRGLDNVSYYKHRPDDPRRAWDTTGCGNTLDASHPRALQLVTDSLRHWAQDYGVDGFRFDLAPALARNPVEFDPRAPILTAIAQDPVLSGLKLIAEPWDVGPSGWRTGGFPVGWGEWNDRFRDECRAFWRGDRDRLAKLTQGLTGSKEIFAAGGRGPTASINYVASHDGFTLSDLVSYEAKHNEANGEGNRDGHGHNVSRNYGIEGETDDPAILAVRARQRRNLLATILLAQGVPMLRAGDEFAQSQGGNNNGYCQDNRTSWLDWRRGGARDPDLFAFVAHLLALRRELPALRRRTFLTGARDPASGLADVSWLRPSGEEMTDRDWADPELRAFGMQTGNDDPEGVRILLLVNASTASSEMSWPLSRGVPAWRPVLDTTQPSGRPSEGATGLVEGGTFALAPRSTVLFRQDI